ncbi:unnamed protein product, partial [Ectocarpus sp. 8 AP-2014]
RILWRPRGGLVGDLEVCTDSNEERLPPSSAGPVPNASYLRTRSRRELFARSLLAFTRSTPSSNLCATREENRQKKEIYQPCRTCVSKLQTHLSILVVLAIKQVTQRSYQHRRILLKTLLSRSTPNLHLKRLHTTASCFLQKLNKRCCLSNVLHLLSACIFAVGIHTLCPFVTLEALLLRAPLCRTEPMRRPIAPGTLQGIYRCYSLALLRRGCNARQRKGCIITTSLNTTPTKNLQYLTYSKILVLRLVPTGLDTHRSINNG